MENHSLWWAWLNHRDHTLLGLELFWWSRIGKVLALLSGFYILVEIVGEAKVKHYLTDRERAGTIMTWVTLGLVFIGACLLNYPTSQGDQNPIAAYSNLINGGMLIGGAVLFLLVWPPLAMKAMKKLEQRGAKQPFQIFSLLLLMLGFALDMLGS